MISPSCSVSHIRTPVRKKGAIKRYSKAVRDLSGEAELKTYFVECGNQFTVDYDDIDEEFYDALNLMFKQAVDKNP